MSDPTLTQRQFTACALYATGLKTGEVAQRMGIKGSVVRYHLDGAMRRMGAKHLGQLMFLLGRELRTK